MTTPASNTPPIRPQRHVGRRVHGLLLRCALVLAAAFLIAMATLSLTQTRIMPVLSDSMSPTIRQHALVVATPIRANDLHVGDVVVFTRPGGSPGSSAANMIMHRIVERLPDGDNVTVRTKGDANTAVDPWTINVNSSAFYRVTTVMPHLGRAYAAAHASTDTVDGALLWPGLVIIIAAAVLGRRQLRHRRHRPCLDTAQSHRQHRRPGTTLMGQHRRVR